MSCLVSWVSEVWKPVVPGTIQVSLQESPPWSKSRLYLESLSTPKSRSELEREGGSQKGRLHTFFFFNLHNTPDGLKISWDVSVSILVRRPEDGARTLCAGLKCDISFCGLGD